MRILIGLARLGLPFLSCLTPARMQASTCGFDAGN